MRTNLTVALGALAMIAGAALPALGQMADEPATAVNVKDDPWCSPRAQFGELKTESPELFARLDVDGDGYVSRAEFVAVCTPFEARAESRARMAKQVAKHFGTMDQDGDEQLSLEEYSSSIM